MSSTSFSKTKQDVWLKFIQHKDVLYELVRYKRSLLLGSENDPVSVSLPPFSSDKRKECRRQGEITVNNYQAASTSTDELKLKANSYKKYDFHTEDVERE
ncbi:hypothetical protein [Psychromonas sp. SR45-3]|uniref:hypothetical protein n=1 Tax=Psychromonas sp. SR45-3 TaxID=2760930 RepID=UPI0015F8590A|nr:hypothetical protein [Psychromonas sp. SR45-3]MBB1274078.1 hypothetical protein [Psychromonas sp. SR45-3]